MRYRGGGVGHSSTRQASNRFLLDRDRLDMPVPDGEERGIEDDLDVDVADAGHVLGGDEGDGAAGDGFGGDEEDNYGYEKHMDDEENSEEEAEEPDLADDALGPEDGEGEGDETYLLGFAVL
jgi:hypothetical protein